MPVKLATREELFRKLGHVCPSIDICSNVSRLSCKTGLYTFLPQPSCFVSFDLFLSFILSNFFWGGPNSVFLFYLTNIRYNPPCVIVKKKKNRGQLLSSFSTCFSARRFLDKKTILFYLCFFVLRWHRVVISCLVQESSPAMCCSCSIQLVPNGTHWTRQRFIWTLV